MLETSHSLVSVLDFMEVVQEGDLLGPVLELLSLEPVVVPLGPSVDAVRPAPFLSQQKLPQTMPSSELILFRCLSRSNEVAERLMRRLGNPYRFDQHVHGLQVGVINVSDDIDGVSIGLINWVENGQKHSAYWASAQELVNLELRFGSRHVYTVAMGGFSSPEEPKRWYAALGIGGTLNLDPFYLNFDAGAGLSRKGWNLESAPNLRAQARVFLVWQVFGRVGVLAGASFNAFAGHNGEDIEISGAPQATGFHGNLAWRMWPSVFLEVQI